MTISTDDGSNPGPGKASVTRCNIISSSGKQSSDITKHPWRSISFVEGMGLDGDPNYIYGEIVILDAIGFYKEFSLHGNEVIELAFETPQKEAISFTGQIYQIGNPLLLGEKQAISLKFCSKEKYLADQYKISVALNKMTYSDMAKLLYGPQYFTGKKELFVEESKGTHSVVIPNWDLTTSLKWLARRANSAKYHGAGYVFYERSGYGGKESTFVFSSLEALIDPEENKPAMTYTYEKRDEIGSLKNMVTVKDYDYLSTPNQIKNINLGMYSSTLLTNDLVRRKHNYYTYDYAKTYPHRKHVNENQVQSGQGTTMLINDKKLTQRPDSAVFLAPKHYQSFNPTSDNLVEQSLLDSNSQLLQMSSIKIRIVVPGDSQRRPGEIVNLKLPAIEPKTNGLAIDPFYSGKYMISKLRHSIDAESNGYDTIIELVKDSYTFPLSEKR